MGFHRWHSHRYALVAFLDRSFAHGLDFWRIGLEWLLGLCFAGGIVLPFLSYPYSQCLWLGLYFVFAYNEMPDSSGKGGDSEIGD